MTSRTLLFGIILAVLIGGWASAISEARAQTVFVTVPQPRVSVSNQVIDFYAGGTSEGYSLRISPQGGSLSINGLGVMNLMPWGFATAEWSRGRIYIIFLVNVTQTDFRIGFLYLTNSSTEAFLLRWFDYDGAGVNLWNFQGEQHVYNRTVSTGTVEMPALKIVPAPTITNQISALGPQIHLTSEGGKLFNGTKSIGIYPLVNQLYGGSSDYNEVWSLLADEESNFYFAILYMQNSDPSHVIIEHRLRLNDYRKFNGQTIDAQWVKGEFKNKITIRTFLASIDIKVDGFPFVTNKYGIASTNVPAGNVTIETPNEVTDSSGLRNRFTSWSKYGNSNPLHLLVNSSLDLTALYSREYPLVISSSYGSPQGSGWYVQGTNATFSVQTPFDLDNRTRLVFQKWQGDSNSTSNESWFIMNSSKSVQALWKTQYLLILRLVGTPQNITAQVLVGNSMVTLNASSPYNFWADANSQVSIDVQSHEIQGSTSNFVFSELLADNQTINGAMSVNKPVNVDVVYTSNPKLITTINLQVSPTTAVAGYPLFITGSIENPLTSGSAVELLLSSDGFNWRAIAAVPISHAGSFEYMWMTSRTGDYYIKALWAGDSEHAPASRVVTVRLVDSPIPTISGGQDALSKFVGDAFNSIRNAPFVSATLALAGSLMSLGYVLMEFIIPGFPLLGYFAGSLFVGFVYVFPISAIVAIVKSVKDRHSLSLLWLVPLLTLWLGSLALILAAFTGNVTPLPFLFAAEILFILSNIFLIPILASLGVAKAIV